MEEFGLNKLEKKGNQWAKNRNNLVMKRVYSVEYGRRRAFSQQMHLGVGADSLFLNTTGGIGMAKLEQTIRGNFDQVIRSVEQGILDGSMSASLEESSDFSSNGARCSVRVFERYSWAGGNRVSLSVTMFQSGDGPIFLSAITAGGSQAMFFKLNTVGEEAFLDKLRELL